MTEDIEMKDGALLLWAMTAGHHAWPMPPAREPVPVVRQASPAPTLPEADRQELRRALKKMAPRLTGKLVHDPVLRMYVPELRDQKHQ